MADGQSTTVANGAFQFEALALNGKPLLPGKYLVEVSSPLADVQPASVKLSVGRDYENLTGEAFKEGEIGRTIEVTRVHVVPGQRNQADERERDTERLAAVRQSTSRECTDTEIRAGRPSRTPKARAAIEKCVNDMMRSIEVDSN